MNDHSAAQVQINALLTDGAGHQIVETVIFYFSQDHTADFLKVYGEVKAILRKATPAYSHNGKAGPQSDTPANLP